MDSTVKADFQKSWDFLKGKFARCEEQILKVLGKDEVKFCTKANKLDLHPVANLMVLSAFEGKWELAYRLLYYTDTTKNPSLEQYTSAKEYKKFCTSYRAEGKRYLSKGEYGLGWHWMLRLHEVDEYIKKGVPLRFDQPAHGDLYTYHVDPDCPADAPKANEGALILINLGFYDRARRYIDILRSYADRPYRSGRGAYRPQYYRACIDFLDALLKARTSSGPEDARRHAAAAIAANFRAVVDCYDEDDAQSSFHVHEPSLALCVATEFEFDTEWSKDCCRAMLFLMDFHMFHEVFRKAVAWDCWMWSKEHYGLLPNEQVEEIWQKTYQLGK